ncbi:MAG: manganese/zinc/iron transport system substrate-binding protein [Crocinitomix sp.]|jgi:manganese/zinc/iron transport system substrate-binding protein
MMKRIIIIMAVVAIAASCRIEEKVRRGPLHIVTTTGIIQDVVENIVGDSAEVSTLMGPGTDPHLYKPTPGDIELLDEADIIISNGLHLEGKMAGMLDKYAVEKTVIKVSDGIDKAELIKSADFDDSFDPHIWFDSKIWMNGMEYVTKELARAEGDTTGYFMRNFESYKEQVEELDQSIRISLASISDSARVLITSHDAFSYFGRRYGIEVKGIQGVSTLSEVGLKDISNMVDFVIERKIKSIFVETSTSDKTAQSIVDGAGDKGYELTLEGPLYSDALGEPDSEGGTYIGMVKANVEVIVKGLK